MIFFLFSLLHVIKGEFYSTLENWSIWHWLADSQRACLKHSHSHHHQSSYVDLDTIDIKYLIITDNETGLSLTVGSIRSIGFHMFRYQRWAPVPYMTDSYGSLDEFNSRNVLLTFIYNLILLYTFMLILIYFYWEVKSYWKATRYIY
jgi:fatty acid desaturase